MLFDTAMQREFKEKFIRKFSNFCKKAPIMMIYEIILRNDSVGVLVTHVNSNTQYFFPFDYSLDVGDFIAQIKQTLCAKHYPRIVETIYSDEAPDTSKIVEKVAEGVPLEAAQAKVLEIGKRLWRIDKIIGYKNSFIITMESSTLENDEIGKCQKRVMATSAMLYLKKYRENKFASIDDASNYFWTNSTFDGDIIKEN